MVKITPERKSSCVAGTFPSITIIILNWNGLPLLTDCLAALAAQTYPHFDILVVDNGSTDGSVAWLREQHPHVRLICNDTNRGFAPAVNQGIRATQSDYIATLNNDTRPDPGWLAALVAAINDEPRVGSCMSKLVLAADPGIIDSTGICIDRAGIVWDRRGGEHDTGQETTPVEVFGPCGGAALYSRAMLDEIGLFDEDFFAYLEDADLAWRARAAGWRCLYVPAARVVHHHSATGGEGSPFKRFQLGRNKLWLLAKNYPLRELWYCLPLVLLYEFLAVAYTLLVRRDVHATRGRLAALRALPKMWRKRPPHLSHPRLDLVHLAAPAWPWQIPARFAHVEKNTPPPP